MTNLSWKLLQNIVDILSLYESLYKFIFVETYRKYIIAKLSIRKLRSSSVLIVHYQHWCIMNNAL